MNPSALPVASALRRFALGCDDGIPAAEIENMDVDFFVFGDQFIDHGNIEHRIEETLHASLPNTLFGQAFGFCSRVTVDANGNVRFGL